MVKSFVNKLTCVLGLLIFFTNTATAKDLLNVFQLAHTNDPILQAAKKSQLAKLESLPQARALFFPTLNTLATHTAFDTNATGTRPHYNQSTYNLAINQPVFYYQQWVGLSQAKEQVKAANADYAAAEQDLIVRVTQSYFNVLRAFDALKFAKAQRTAVSKFLEQTQQRYKVGLIAITDVQIAQAQHDNAYAQEITAENNLANKEEMLREITGEPIETYSFLRKELSLKPPEPLNTEEWVNKALAQNLSLQAKEFSVKATRANIRMVESGHLPTLSVTSKITRMNSEPLNPGSRNSNVGLQVNMPIFSGGSVQSKTRQAVYTYEASKKEFETLHRQIESKTRQAYRGVLTQISQATALKQAIVSNQSALDATEAAFNVGSRTIVDVLNSQTSLIQAQQNYANARYDYILQSIQLKQATGTLTPEDIYYINAWLTQEK